MLWAKVEMCDQVSVVCLSNGQAQPPPVTLDIDFQLRAPLGGGARQPFPIALAWHFTFPGIFNVL